MTVYKNMAFGLELRKVDKAEIDKRVREAARVLDIEHLLDRKPKALSGGQRQRVALGRAMVRNPAVFLLDEPLSNLDAKLRTSMRTEIIKLHQKLATTFIYVTHDQTEAMTMGDRIVVMKDGIVQQVDTPQNLYDFPINMFVAGFIGSPQMNFLDATLNKDGNGYFLDLAGDRIDLPKEKTTDGKLDAYVGKKVKAGVRPEDIKDDPEFVNKQGECKLEATVEVSELMGSEIYLYLQGQQADRSCSSHLQGQEWQQRYRCLRSSQDPSVRSRDRTDHPQLILPLGIMLYAEAPLENQRRFCVFRAFLTVFGLQRCYNKDKQLFPRRRTAGKNKRRYGLCYWKTRSPLSPAAPGASAWPPWRLFCGRALP